MAGRRLRERVERVSGREEYHASMPEQSRRDRSSLQKPIPSQLQIIVRDSQKKMTVKHE